GREPQRPRLVCFGPGKAAPPHEALGAHPHARPVEVEQFHPVFPSIGKDIEMAAQRVFFELVRHQIAQPLETLAQIRRARGQINARGRTQGDHRLGSSCNKEASSPGEKRERTSRRSLPGHCRRWAGPAGGAGNKLGTATKEALRSGLTTAFLSQAASVETPIPDWAANSFWVNWLRR